MTSQSYDVIVAGVGAMGSAACWHLAQRGLKVLGLERFDLGHAMGSSHGLNRIIRLAYFEGSHYVPIVRRAHELWAQTGAEAGMQLLHVTGSVDLAPEGAGMVESSLKSCLDHGLTHEVLDGKEIARRFPAFHLPAGHLGLWQPDGGFVASEKAIYAHVGLAQSRGADIRTNEPLLDWSPTADGGVTVRTERGTYSAGRLVITSGGWITDAVPALASKLTTVRQAIGWFTTRRPELFRQGAFPVFILTVEEGNFYGFPLYEHPGFKLGGPHFAREPMDPRDPDRTPSPQQVAMIRECLARYLPDAAGDPLTLKGCVYTVSPDEDFVIDTVPGVPQAVFASCCSGHGFKFASAIGEILADLSTSGRSAFNLSPFSLGRLAA
ncbi:N-methyl-L-tryptophan oxidase [Bosea caraganae]|uniref:N-methyl-L-tryptophan oxidase n=1 Tax=Bosea caraganae TaxID=2763117 RepID=A0A370L388_9HYPH|nr:N-methyl-L-tryptophan oxidase [Bosea caraganae]RDJ22894.1 N-methyl-L-tryptophan oxidase [Bosea caraganae]RDJ28674.1 N-methyl-L-tryptophan oxidase [Bosea caraganae]